MLGELMRVGDKVVVTIPKENRDWGYNPCPDGTIAEVLGFSEISWGRIGWKSPGVYENRSWVNIRAEVDGKTKEWYEYAMRCELVNSTDAVGRERIDGLFLRDLPETDFWECDIVKIAREDPEKNFVICKVKYENIGKFCNDGVTPLPIYDYSDNIHAGWYASCRTKDVVTLVQRGDIWKYYHNKPIKFADLKEEADFARLIGKTEEVRNPKTKLYVWSKNQALSAIRSNIAHAMEADRGMFSGKPYLRVIKFHDEDLGKRVARATLQGFNTKTKAYIPRIGASKKKRRF